MPSALAKGVSKRDTDVFGGVMVIDYIKERRISKEARQPIGSNGSSVRG